MTAIAPVIQPLAPATQARRHPSSARPWPARALAPPPSRGPAVNAGAGFHDETWRAMGTDIRILIRASAPPGQLAEAAAAARAWIDVVARELTRFDPASSLARLNAARGREVRVSRVLAAAVAAALDAARATGGLADPTVLDALERAGYARSREGVAPLSLADALAAAPLRRPAGPGSSWRRVRVDRAAGTVRLPRGIRLDLGGIGKGFAADVAAWAVARAGLPHGWSTVADCGGDIRSAGAPSPVLVQDPFTDAAVARLALAGDAVATSGIDRRIWAGADGTPAHHLIDPARGRPAWTGIVSATAIAPTATAAEARAKAALLAGPRDAPRVLRDGGVLIHDDGRVEVLK